MGQLGLHECGKNFEVGPFILRWSNLEIPVLFAPLHRTSPFIRGPRCQDVYGWDRTMDWYSVGVVMIFFFTGFDRWATSGAGPECNLSGHTASDKTGGDKALCSTNPRVGYIVEVIKTCL
jgi:hypothetical protein